LIVILALIGAALSFVLSASAGLGGSLLLVPILGLLLGTKQGVAAASLLLAFNNVAKVVVYRQTIPWKAVLGVGILTVVGSVIGAQLLVAMPEAWVGAAVVAAFVITFLLERTQLPWLHRSATSLLAFSAGATSGFSGTSGPLKGAALRNLGFDRLHFVGAASAVSLAGDVTKSIIFTQASLFEALSWMIVVGALLLMPLAVLAGRHLSQRMGEKAHTTMFWTVMVGYSVRLLVT
jgi:uncharacterized protein